MSHDSLSKLFVWWKATPAPWLGPNYRVDRYGFPMREEDYGDRGSDYGWEIDHVVPVSAGGTDDLSNLQPLSWRANASIGDRYPKGPSLYPWYTKLDPPWGGDR